MTQLIFYCAAKPCRLPLVLCLFFFFTSLPPRAELMPCSEKGDPDRTPLPSLPIWPCLSCVVNHSRKVVANSQRPTLAYPHRECSASSFFFFFFEVGKTGFKGWRWGGHTQKTLKCVKDNPKENKTLWPVVSFRGHLFVLVMIQLVSPVGVWRCRVFCATTRASSWLTAVYFVCVTKRLRLRSPFLFSQWKGEIDGYHLCAAALFGRYQTFFTGIAAFFPEQMITRTHTSKDSFILSWMFFLFFFLFVFLFVFFCCRLFLFSFKTQLLMYV